MKPGFFKNEELCALSPFHRLGFEGLWCCADRDGRLEDRPKRLKAEIFPYDDLDFDALMWDLMHARFIIRYAVSQPLVWIPTWAVHQHPRPDETDSILPPYEPGTERHARADHHALAIVPLSISERPTDTPPSLPSHAPVTPARSGSGVLGLGSGVLGLGSGVHAAEPRSPRKRPPSAAAVHGQDLIDLWNTTTTPPIPRCRQLTDERRRQIRARMATRPSMEEWRIIFATIEASAYCRGENDRDWYANFDWIIRNDTNPAKMLERALNGAERSPPSPVSAQGRANAEAMQRAANNIREREP